MGKFSSPNLAWNCIVFAAPHARPFLSTIGHPMQSVDPARSFEGGKEVFFSSHTTHHKRERARWGNVSRILWTAAGSRRASAAIHGSVPLVSGRTREATVPGAGRYWWRRWTHHALGTVARFPRKSSSCSRPNRRPARAWGHEASLMRQGAIVWRAIAAPRLPFSPVPPEQPLQKCARATRN